MDATEISLFARSFVYLRHGETESNAAGLIAGSWDVALTARGRAQARRAALALRDQGITAIYSSTLERARETAAIVAGELGLPVTPVAELCERNWGSLEGQPRAARVPGTTPPEAEPPQVFLTRVLRGFMRVEGVLPLVVAHSGVYRALCRTLRLPEPGEPIPNCTPLRLTPPPCPGAAWRIDALTV